MKVNGRTETGLLVELSVEEIMVLLGVRYVEARDLVRHGLKEGKSYVFHESVKAAHRFRTNHQPDLLAVENKLRELADECAGCRQLAEIADLEETLEPPPDAVG